VNTADPAWWLRNRMMTILAELSLWEQRCPQPRIARRVKT
jgi:hypothetical protein